MKKPGWKHIHSRIISKDVLLEDLRRVSRELEKNSVTRDEYEKLGNHTAKTYERKFDTWNNSLVKAGLKKNLERNISQEDLFKNLEDMWIRFGRQPKYEEIHRPLSKYSGLTYANRFGSWNKALEHFIEYVNAEPKEEDACVEDLNSQSVKKVETEVTKPETPVISLPVCRRLIRQKEGFPQDCDSWL